MAVWSPPNRKGSTRKGWNQPPTSTRRYATDKIDSPRCTAPVVAVALAHAFAVRRRRRLGPTLHSWRRLGRSDRHERRRSSVGKPEQYPTPFHSPVHEVPDVVAVLVRAAVGVLGATRGEVGARRTYPRRARAVVPAQDELTAALRACGVALADVFAVRRPRYRCALRRGGAVGDVSVDRIAIGVCTARSGEPEQYPTPRRS